ncbi:MAG: hypothetical protein HC838_05615 [Spirulinaceae cyanobacterium RM2_2_10]|nr:hypothetical protein [Spirulinaceae cyanobacterium SM2_1_0]NJO19640.1 hypothetical protein [Spirulinaceae cyanobacterium RM2_2_10]
MGKLQQELVAQLVALPPNEKLVIGDRLVRALGGDPTPQVTGLPARRGRADGGLDGRVPILIQARMTREKLKRRADGQEWPVPLERSEFSWQAAVAGFNVKLEKTRFERDTLNAFVENLRRETIFAGVIVTAAGLSPDAIAELERHNNHDMDLCSLELADLLAGVVTCGNIRFLSDDLSEQLRVNLREFLATRA